MALFRWRLGLLLAALGACGAPPAAVAPPAPVEPPPPPPAAPPAPTFVRNPPLAPLPARLVIQRAPEGGLGAALAVSKDGFVATWTDDNTLRFWELQSRSLVRSIPGSTLHVDELVKPVRPVWDDATKEVILNHRDGLLGVDLNGKQRLRAWPSARDQVLEVTPLASGSARWVGLGYGRFRLLDASAKTIADLASPEKLGSDIAVSGDGKWAIAGYGAGIVRFAIDQLPVKAKVIKLPSKPLASEKVTASQSLAITPAGDAAFVCAKTKKGEDTLLSVSNLGGAPNVRAVKLADDNGCKVVAAADGKLVVAALGDALFGIDAHTTAVRWRAPVSDLVANLAIQPNGRAVIALTAGLHGGGATTVLDAATGNVLGDLGERIEVPEILAFQKDDALIAATRASSMLSTRHHVADWSLRDGSLTETATVDWGTSTRLDEDGSLSVARTVLGSKVCAKGEVALGFSVGTLATGAPSGEATRGTWPPAPSKDAIVCLPAGARTFAVDARGGRAIIEQRGKPTTYTVVDAAGASHVLKDMPAKVNMIGLWLSRDGRWVMGAPPSRGGFSQLYVWSATTGEKVGEFTADPADPPGLVLGDPTFKRRGYWVEDVSDDGSVVAVASGDRVTLYELPSKTAARTIELPGDAYVTAVAMAPGSSTVALIGFSNGDLVMSKPGEPLLRGDSTGGAIATIRGRRDGARVATVSNDGAVRLWEGHTMEPLAALVEFADGEFLATTPRGAYAGTLEAADRVRWVFDGPTEGFAFQQFAKTFQRPDLLAARVATAAQDIPDTMTRPPRVEVVPPPARVPGTSVAVASRVSSASNVSSLRAFVEGRLAASKDVGARSAEVTVDVPILPGSSTVTLLAFDDKGASSNPQTFEVTSTKKGGGRPDVWVVAVGVARYSELGPDKQLEATVNDARSIAAAFAAQAAPGKRFAKAHTTLLTEDEVTPASVVTAIEGLSAMRPEDLAVVFFAGHGAKMKGRPDMVFLTGSAKLEAASFDRSGIGWNKIGAALGRAKGHVLVLVDACQSGHMSQDLIVPNSTLADDLVRDQRAGVVVFAASKGRQYSYEARTSRAVVLSPEQEGQVVVKAEPSVPAPKAARSASVGHGFFTGAILRTLETPASDVDGDGSIELSELIAQVTLRVSKGSNGAQTPWVARRELFGDFIVARAAK